MSHDIKACLAPLKLPDDAVKWLVALYESAQTFDDYADGDEVKREDLDKLIWNTLVGMHLNPFYMQHSSQLWPLVATAVLKWKASDVTEKDGKANAVSFVWRAGYYDIVLFVFALCHGQEKAIENSHVIMNMYGEKLEDYLQEVT